MARTTSHDPHATTLRRVWSQLSCRASFAALGAIVVACAATPASERIGTTSEELADPWRGSPENTVPASAPWLIVLCQAGDYYGIPTGDDAGFYTKMFTTGYGGVADFWQQQSAGNTSLGGNTVAGWTIVSGTTSYVNTSGGDNRRWLNATSKAQAIAECINTQQTLPNFGSFYNYLALWNVIVGAQGGIPTVIAGRTVPAVALDVGTPPWGMQHEMGHGFTLDHAFGDSINSNCGGDGRAGAYQDADEVMGECGPVPWWNGSLCPNNWNVGNTYATNCTYAPGVNLWGLYNLGWSISRQSNYGFYITAAWPNSSNGSVPIVPRSRPDIAGYRGVYIPAHAQYGYMVELQSGFNADQGITTPQVVLHRVFYNNALSFLVQEANGIQTTTTQPFSESNEGTLTIGVQSISSTQASVSWNFVPGPAVWWNRDFGYPLVNNPTFGDWSSGNYKGQCWPGQAITAVSRFDNGSIQSHGLQCGPRSFTLNSVETYGAGTGGTGNPNVYTLNNNDNRCTNDNNWDWDSGSYKLECCADEVMAGVSQSASGNLRSILCESANSPNGPALASRSSSNCTTEVFYNGDSRDYSPPDWDPGYYKGQCPSGYYAAGISTPAFPSVGVTGAAHGLLCCSP